MVGLGPPDKAVGSPPAIPFGGAGLGGRSSSFSRAPAGHSPLGRAQVGRAGFGRREAALGPRGSGCWDGGKGPGRSLNRRWEDTQQGSSSLKAGFLGLLRRTLNSEMDSKLLDRPEGKNS